MSDEVVRVRDAMVVDPRTIASSAPAVEAGQLLTRPEVRAVYVCDGERLAGVVTRKTLVAGVVAAGRDPRTTPVGLIAEEPHYTLEPDEPLDQAFQFLEEHDAERVPITEDGRLVGVLHRSAVQRRLAEDTPPEPAGDQV